MKLLSDPFVIRLIREFLLEVALSIFKGDNSGTTTEVTVPGYLFPAALALTSSLLFLHFAVAYQTVPIEADSTN